MLFFYALFKKINALIILSLLMLTAGLVSSVSASEINAVPLNPRFVEWQKKMDTRKISSSGKIDIGYSEAETNYGYIPSPVNWSHLEKEVYSVINTRLNNFNKQGSLPTSYDLRAEMPVVKDQGPFGTCWTFSAMAASESNLIHEKKVLTEENADLSEWYLVYYGFNDESEDLPSFTNDTGYPYHDVGGNDWVSAALLARGTGSIKETSAQYPQERNSHYRPDVTKRKYKLKNALYLGNAGYLEVPINDSRRDLMKDAIRKYGAVSVGILAAGDSAGYLNENTGAYFTDNILPPNHAVSIVGWDDNYSKGDFGKYKPSSDGVWIMRNSWGANWGEDGYCYVSYEEKSLCYGVAYDTEGAPDKEKIYQYDPLGLCKFIIYGSANPIYFANIFKASRNEKINSVSFYTSYPDTLCTVKIYTDCGENPVGGTFAAGKSLTVAAPGYNTVDLEKEIEISKYSKFSVVVSQELPAPKSPSECPQIPIETPIKSYSEKAVAAKGQSFLSSNGTAWDDLTEVSGYKNANVCIKAFGTSDDDPADGGSSGGCSTGAGMIMLLVLAVLPFTYKGKKH